ncbi:MAG: carboxypeptidase regulatory-like domain-containing protein [Candidatus Solibacter usitatus]|nr:carboxypeptidase regulatory-like domain-containing protein [Candidatus Solibacter usitatus]
MKRYSAAVAALWLAACASEKKTETPAEKPAPAPASVSGKVVFEGKPPMMPVLKMSEEAACVRLHKSPVRSEEVVVNEGGTLANVFVWVKSGLEGKTFEPAKDYVTIDQRGCTFRPHVIGIRAGQALVVVNSDPVSHNIHPMPKENREWNQGQAPQTPNLERQFARPEIMIPVKCNVHSWMRSYIGVVDHPYFAVTGEQGAFELKGLPPGEYTVAAWHEKYGTKEQKVTLAPAASQSLDFTFQYRGKEP